MQNDNCQRHTEKQTSLRDKKHDQGISPAKLFADGVIFRQIPEQIEKTLRALPVIFEKPEKAESAAKKQKHRRDFSRQTAAG